MKITEMKGGMVVQIGIGVSELSNARQAVKEALHQALHSLQFPDLTFVFYAGDYDPQQVWEAAKTELHDREYIGGSVAGLLTYKGVINQGVSVLALTGITATTAILDLDPEHVFASGQQVGDALAAANHSSGTVMMFPSACQVQVSALIRGVYSRLGPGFNYYGSGIMAQFTNKGLSTNGIAAVLLNGVCFTHRIGHGWMPFGEPMLVTKADRNVVYELDGQPALERYRKMINQLVDQDAASIDKRFQLGIPCKNQEYLVRDIIGTQDQALICVTEITQRSMTSLMTTSVPALPAIAKRIVEEAFNRHAQPQFALVFDDFSRKELLQHDFVHEMDNIFRVLKDLPTLGLLTYGAISCPLGTPLFYCKSLSVSVGGEGA